MEKAVPALERVPDSTLRKVSRLIESERLLHGVTRVLVGVSGGPDSVALLMVLCRLRETAAVEIVAAHFDHRLRPDSAGDRDWVRGLCESLRVDCLTAEGDVAALAGEKRTGIEAAARTMRYRFLAFAAGQRAADCVATGHTANDQAETVLMHILRGSGIRGLRGMLPSGYVPGAPAIRLIRPCLTLSAEETAAVCSAAGVEPRRDVSNDDTSFLRNRLHRETLPALRAINPSVDESLRRLAGNAREAFRPVQRAADRLRPLSRGSAGSLFSLGDFRSLPTEARSLVVERELAAIKLEPNVNRTVLHNLDQILGSGSGRVRFGEGEVEVSTGLVRVGAAVIPERSEQVVLNIPGTTVMAAWRIVVASEASSGGDAVNGIVPEGVLRARPPAPGDRVLQNGRWRRLRRVVSEQRVPAWERRNALAVADGRGVIAVASPSGWRCGGGNDPDGLSLRLERLQGGPHGPTTRKRVEQ